MARNARQQKILELISKKDIETQDELAYELQQADFVVTQATISRDIKELGLVKITTDSKKQKYVRELSDYNVSSKLLSMYKHAVLSIDHALNIVVIKTLAGGASAAGMMVDRLENSDILGCVAGDDTVMIVSRSERDAADIALKLTELLNR